jgi:hypothetical protein
VRLAAHGCNNPLACPECIRRFWKWAENHTRGRSTPYSRQARVDAGHHPGHANEYSPSFYEAAAKWIDVDARARR